MMIRWDDYLKLEYIIYLSEACLINNVVSRYLLGVFKIQSDPLNPFDP